jgi:hypothetical protein
MASKKPTHTAQSLEARLVDSIDELLHSLDKFSGALKDLLAAVEPPKPSKKKKAAPARGEG